MRCQIMTSKIENDGELRQSMFLNLRYMANKSLLLAGYAGAEYPWEIADAIHDDYFKAKDRGDKKDMNTLQLANDAIWLWRESLIELGNVSNIPDVDNNKWFLDER